MKIIKNDDAVFLRLPRLSQKHYDIIRDNIQDHYLTYSRRKKELDDSGFYEMSAGTVCRCSYCCNQIFIKKLPQNEIILSSLKHNNVITCPECGHTVTAKADGRGRKSIHDYYRLAVFIPVGFNMVWVRCFDWLYADYTDVFEPKEIHNEVERVLLTRNGAYHWKHCGGELWKHFDKPCEPFNYNIVMTTQKANYSVIDLESTDETFLKYSAYKEYFKGYTLLGLIKYFEYYCKYPCLEYIVKAGFDKLAISLVECGKKGGGYLNWKANNFYEFFKLGKADIKALALVNPDSDIAADYISFVRKHPEIKNAVERLYNVLKGRRVDIVNQILSCLKFPAVKVFNYLDRTKTPPNDYLDYIKQCIALGYSLTEKRAMFPKDFTAAHNLATKALKIIADEKTNKLIKKRKEFLSRFIFENERFIIVIPESAEEIINEGEALNHCVGGYAEDHAKGETNILFLRNKRKPDKPFYTIEISNNGEIEQCRGYKNCEETKKTAAFMEEFEAFAKKEAKRKNTKKSKIKIQIGA